MSRGSSRGSSSTTSTTPRVRVPRHFVRFVTRLVVDYFASRRLVVDYFAYAARPGASARRAARHPARRRLLRLRLASGCLARRAAHRAARRRLLHLHHTSGCFGTSRGMLRDSSSTTPPTPRIRVPGHVARLVTQLAAPLVVDYFAYAARPGASARRAARHPARRRLLRLRRASGCLGTSRSLSRGLSSTTSPRAGSSSTTSPTPRIRVPRHVTRLVVWFVARLVVDYFAYAARSGASAPCTARRRPRVVMPLDFSSVGHTGSRRAPGRSVSRLDYFVRCRSTCCPVALALLQPRCAS
jgi:hypothetical protein